MDNIVKISDDGKYVIYKITSLKLFKRLMLVLSGFVFSRTENGVHYIKATTKYGKGQLEYFE